MSKKHLTLEERKLILNLHVKQKKSYAEIGKILSRSRLTIQSVVGRFKYEGRVNNKRKPGRPKILSAGDLLAIKRMVAKDPFISTSKITGELLRNRNIEVNPETVRLDIIKAGFKSRTPRKNP